MVKNTIKIYARLKDENSVKAAVYEVFRKPKKDIITFHRENIGDFFLSKPTAFRFGFEKVFDEHFPQEKIFSILAKPVIRRVLEGHNATIFAYGQTGSGKTYTMTGSSEYFEERGVIPRSIEEIFNFTKENPNQYTIYISYLEIYNEIGYDLLNSKHQFSSLEELPLLGTTENSKRRTSMHNLRCQRVSSEEEAMMLLLVGDSNRITVETSRNMFSSRSHCIFTITITSKITSGKFRKSILNLVDLAGSERINKSNISGKTLNEAKHINLSLHYLQHVVLALCQKRNHVPFRNSMLTYLLKDSLSGNCLTVLLAMIDVKKENLEETIATCKFSQRVGNVIIETELNEEIDPQKQIDYLKGLIKELQVELTNASKFKRNGSINKEERNKCKLFINNYLDNPKDDLTLGDMDMRKIRYCFKLLKQIVNDHKCDQLKLQHKEKENQHVIKEYSKTVKDQGQQITHLSCLLNSKPPKRFSTSSTESKLSPTLRIGMDNVTATQKSYPEIFTKDPNNRMDAEFYNESIDKIHKNAKYLNSLIEQYQKDIVNAKRNLQTDNSNSKRTKEHLLKQQHLYRESLAKLQALKMESDQLKMFLHNQTETLMKNEKLPEHKNSFINETQTFTHISNCSQASCQLEESNKENNYLNFFCPYNAYTCNKKLINEKCNHNHTDSSVLTNKTLSSENSGKLRGKPYVSSSIDNSAFTDITQFQKNQHNMLSTPKSNSPDELAVCSNASSNTRNYQYYSVNEFGASTSDNYKDVSYSPINCLPSWETPEKDVGNGNENLITINDPPEFKEFINKVTLTGDRTVDEEIVRFYRTKFMYTKNL